MKLQGRGVKNVLVPGYFGPVHGALERNFYTTTDNVSRTANGMLTLIERQLMGYRDWVAPRPKREDTTMAQKYTDEEIKQRFEMAENFQDQLEEQLLKDCPAEIVDKFRVGDERELYRVLLIAPGMELEEGIYNVQLAPEHVVDLGLEPTELCLECGPSLEPKYRVRYRSEVPSSERLIQEPMHAINEPTTWQQIVDWTRALISMGVFETGSDNE